MIQRKRSKHHSGSSIGSTNLSSVASSVGSHSRKSGRSSGKDSHFTAASKVYLPSCSPYRSCLKEHHRSVIPKNSSHSSSKKKKTVRFKKILIREYERICGDNPSCSAGPPIGIGWKHSVDVLISVEQFENDRFLQRSQSSKELVLSRAEREDILQAWGVSHSEMVEAVRINVKVKNQRRQTANNVGKYDRVEEMMEATSQKMKLSFKFRLSGGGNQSESKKGSKLGDSRQSTSSRSGSENSPSCATEPNNKRFPKMKPSKKLFGMAAPSTVIEAPPPTKGLLSGPDLPVIELQRSPSVESALTDANWSRYVPKEDEDSSEEEEEEDDDDGISEMDMEEFEEDFTVSNLTNFEDEEDDATLPTKFLSAFDDFCLKHMQDLDEFHPKLLRRADMERPSTALSSKQQQPVAPSPSAAKAAHPERAPEGSSSGLSMEKEKPLMLLQNIYVPPPGGDRRPSAVGRPMPLGCTVCE